jgi:hypothetical protein
VIYPNIAEVSHWFFSTKFIDFSNAVNAPKFVTLQPSPFLVLHSFSHFTLLAYLSSFLFLSFLSIPFYSFLFLSILSLSFYSSPFLSIPLLLNSQMQLVLVGVGVVWCGVGVGVVWCGCGVGVVWVWCGCGVVV